MGSLGGRKLGEEDIMHIFLPKKLPGEETSSSTGHRNMIILLRTAIATWNNQNFIPIPNTEKAFANWTQFEKSTLKSVPFSTIIQNAIKNLQEGELVPLYLTKQNAGIFISSEKFEESEDAIVVSTFQASCRSEAVMSSQADLLVNFPEQSIRIPKSELLQSPEFGKVLDLLISNSFEMAMPKAIKAKREYVETRDVADPMFATDWLTHLLCNDDSESYSDFPQIAKKIRDDVILGDNVGVPFRRSGLWMTAKVALHVCLIRELGEKIGTFVYKWIMLCAMKDALEIFHLDTATNHTDLKVQMMRKIARRLIKLQMIKPSMTTGNDDHDILLESALPSMLAIVANLLCDVEQNLQSDWQLLAQNDPALQDQGEINISNSDMDSMLAQSCPNVINEIETRTAIRNQNAGNNIAATPPIPRCPDRVSPNAFPSMLNLSDHETDFELFEIENWVRLNLDGFDQSNFCSPIKSLMLNYSKKAMRHYENDPIGNSRLVLTVVKCIQILDKIAVKQYPLYKEHNSGLGLDIGFMDRLILSRKIDMQMAFGLEQYFKNRDLTGTESSLISENQPSENSFGVRFARGSVEMNNLLEQILEKIQTEIKAKEEEVLRVREECNDLRRRISILSCECKYEYNNYTRTYYRTECCSKCSLQDSLNEKLFSVSHYEKRLPDNQTKQYAVVFELRIPEELAILRDMLYYFNVDILNQIPLQTDVKIKIDWVTSTFVGEYCNAASKDTNLRLGSTSKTSGGTHWTYNNISVEKPEIEFILPNGMEHIYNGRYILGDKTSSFESRFTFLISNPKSNYKGMQWAIDGTDHNANDVLARQCECPQNLSIPEFVQFGCLRAGKRIQYRNIVLALTSDNLSWKSEEVFMLLCQTQFQFGKSDLFDWVREAHVDLLDEVFAEELLRIVENKIDSNEKKWSDPYTLCCLISIVGRVLEVGNVKHEAAELLRKCRKNAVDWIFTLQGLIGKAYAASEDEKNALKSKMVLSAIAASLTFSVSPEHVNFVMSTSKDLLNWMHAISTLYNEVFWNLSGRIAVLKITPVQRSLLRLAICTGLTLERAINNINKTEAFKKFTSHNWKIAQSFLGTWSQCASPQIYQNPKVLDSNGSEHHIYVDIIFGRFLVDGLPVRRLPEAIVRSPLYQRVFQKAEFTVQPEMGNDVTVFSTSSKFKDCIYRFYEQGSKIIIQELCEVNGQNQTLELLLPGLLNEDFPASFSDSYSHWWNSETNVILFRPVQFDLPNFEEIKYEWSVSSNHLKEMTTSRQLISIHSNAFIQLCADLQKIEALPQIHAWLTTKGIIEVDLTLLGLRFFLTKERTNRRLTSREYPNMFVDPNQNIGTLVGLQNKLILTEPKIDVQPARKVIVPHGNFTISDDTTKGHQQVITDLTGIRNPPFFVYDINDMEYHRKILTAGKSESAWLYLAALHGATASPLPDPFTSVTGTEMAFQILQSPRLRSCHPYDEECTQTLEMISGFSPKRKFYPEHLQCQQKITWPSGLPSLSAHEGFTILAEELVQNSQKLRQLFLNEDELQKPIKDFKDTTDPFLCYRHYWRQSLLDNDLVRIPHLDRTRPTPEIYERGSLLASADIINGNVRLLSHLCQEWKPFCGPTVRSVRQLLVSKATLLGYKRPLKRIKTMNFVTTMSDFADLRNCWMDLYRLALSVGKHDFLRHWWVVLLTSLAFEGVEIQQLGILHIIATHRDKFAPLRPPKIDEYKNPASIFSTNELEKILNNNAVEFDDSRYSILTEKQKARNAHEIEVESNIAKLCAEVKSQWVPREVNKINLSKWGIDNIEVSKAEKEINVLIQNWFDNSILDEFLEQFEAILKTIIEESQNHVNPTFPQLEKLSNICDLKHPCPHFDLASIVQSRTYFVQTATEEAAFNQKKNKIFGLVDYDAKHFNTPQEFFQCLKSIQSRSSAVWTKLTDLLNRSIFGASSLIYCGLFPRLVPSTLLPVLLWERSGTFKGSCNLTKIQSLVGAVGVYWTLEQKMARCIRHLRDGPSMEVALQREKETVGLKTWSPRQHPQWLLLELELNMTIRPIQVKVAEAMLNPSSKSNSVLQLNMGEGKTSLIVPMLAASIANGKQLCRVTVIKSIFETNVNWLKHTLGGLLNQRVYVLPCRRDIDFDVPLVSKMESVYKECLQNKGVVVTLPEFRLSFQLKGYEFARKGNTNLASPLIKLQKWLDEYCRDILDESDDILSVKYQLIYTVGSPQVAGGGSLRWEVIQKLLKRLPVVMKDLKNKYGDSAVEYSQEDEQDNSIFGFCRLLRSDVYHELITKLADDFIDGLVIGFPELKPHEKSMIHRFLTDNSVTTEDIQAVLDLPCVKDAEEKIDILLILAAYLRFGVLESALFKRWRVNYGVNPKGHRKMAVPFKAKDVASERTEFGHPDMAIVLTQISYYYSGISDNQLLECFHFLSSKFHVNPADEYSRWIERVPASKIHPSIQDYKGINLEDHEQRTQLLFPVLRRSTAVIDFWLSNFVYPKESKQFERKMTCTAWDLVSENKRLLTTGFSGTNDSKKLLPGPISQNDLPELENTNRELEAVLVRPEMNYQHFESDITSVGILQELERQKIKVLLDCGALVLQLNNEQVAEKWLDIDSSLEAVVFFNNKNFITVLDRETKQMCSFDLSPFQGRLDVCGVYLDDEHTRGPNFKFPQGARACVTLGIGLTRDKMVQACMRMRMLGQGHVVTFYASNEVHNKIETLSGRKPIGGHQVLDWVNANSQQFQEDGLIYWTNSAVNYAKKLGTEMIFKAKATETEEGYRDLGEQCSDAEIVDLHEIYCHARHQALFSIIYQKWFTAAKACLIQDSLPFPEEVETLFAKIETMCKSRITQFIPDKLHFSQLLDEEQEKELEKEVEQEAERQLPGKATPCTHSISRGLLRALNNSGTIVIVDNNNGEDLFPIVHALTFTNIMDKLQSECWGDSVLCTGDFAKTVERESRLDTLTEFLRPVNWIVKLRNSSGQPVIVAISPFEANELTSAFREKKFNASLHLYNARTTPNQKILIDNPRLTLPSSTGSSNLTPWVQLLPPLSTCAGNLYFETVEEETATSTWLGIIPRPRGNLQQYFDEGFLSAENGFAPPDKRNFPGCPISGQAFYSDPEGLVGDISKIRNQSLFPANSHVASIVMNGEAILHRRALDRAN